MPPSTEDTAELLSRVPVFAELGADDLGRVAQVAVPRSYDGQQVIFREGDDSDTCYIVRSGHARAIRQHSDGRTITLARFGPGDIFGELAMFDDERRSATVEALDDLSTVAIPGSAMRGLLERHPAIAVKLVIALGRRLRAANERLSSQSFQTVQSRVAAVLDQLVEQARAEGEGGQRDVLVTATQAELAQLAGSSRESASRFLAVLERAGVISQGRGRLTVHDPAAVRGYVYGARALLRRGRRPRRRGARHPPRRAAAGADPAQGRRGRRREPRGDRPARGAGGDRGGRTGGRATRGGRVPLPARGRARVQDRRVLPLRLRLRRHRRPRPRGRKGAVDAARARPQRAQLPGGASDDRARPVATSRRSVGCRSPCRS